MILVTKDLVLLDRPFTTRLQLPRLGCDFQMSKVNIKSYQMLKHETKQD